MHKSQFLSISIVLPKWKIPNLANRRLFGEKITEEMAVKQITSIYNDLSMKTINHAWRSTGISKFQSLPSEHPENVTSDDIQNELNERLN